MALLLRLLLALPFLAASPVLLGIPVLGLAACDLCFRLFGRRRLPPDTRPATLGATVVIPNWNGRDLLEKYIPSIETALAGNPANEIIVVDNASQDGSAEFLAERHPAVRVLRMERNLGFGGGSNAGFRAARNDIVVLLNSDMRVAPDFLQPLLDGFYDETVFAVSCQIFFSDPKKLREETGLTQAWWQEGSLRVRHRIDEEVRGLYPCFYGGGGSCAFDRRKFLELGGFDSILEPFYLEDTDLGFLAWKRGWKVFYQPRSVVWHEHRGTIGKKFSQDYIQGVLKKNFLLFCWKNIHEWPRLLEHFAYTVFGSLVAVALGDAWGRPNWMAVARAFSQLPGALRSRWRALRLAAVSDTEAFRRPLGAWFRDRFGPDPDPAKLKVLFASPYPIVPPVHGGGVFMYEALRELAPRCETHVVGMLDWEGQMAENETLRSFCASAEFVARPQRHLAGGHTLLPHAVAECADADFDWLIHRQTFLHNIDVHQLEYTSLAQYLQPYRRIAGALFEHDVYFQSVARARVYTVGLVSRMKVRYEYLKALRYELRALHRADTIQACTPANRDYILSFEPALAPKIHAGVRAGIRVREYAYTEEEREPFTMLFVGSFRHTPNMVALDWFGREVLPGIVAREPRARLVVAGSDPPPAYSYGDVAGAIEMLGFVDDIRPLFSKYAVFVCPILSGSGVRVKLLEAFAAGIPVVSTRVGAEGLAAEDGSTCALADDPGAFGDRVLALFADREKARQLSRRARREVEENWDMPVLIGRLVESYRDALRAKVTSSRASD